MKCYVILFYLISFNFRKSGISASFSEMLLLMAIHFHSNQVQAVLDLICSTLGMKVKASVASSVAWGLTCLQAVSSGSKSGLCSCWHLLGRFLLVCSWNKLSGVAFHFAAESGSNAEHMQTCFIHLLMWDFSERSPTKKSKCFTTAVKL